MEITLKQIAYKPWRGAKTTSDDYADRLHTFSLLICKRCGLEQTKGTREATRDFVFADICVGCNMKENQ